MDVSRKNTDVCRVVFHSLEQKFGYHFRPNFFSTKVTTPNVEHGPLKRMVEITNSKAGNSV